MRLVVRPRGSDRPIESDAAWVINCTGPTPSNCAESNPVIGSLLVHGWLLSDELALGIETSPEGHARDADGRIVPDLFVVGDAFQIVPELTKLIENAKGNLS